MSVEQKIAELLAESNKNTETIEETEEISESTETISDDLDTTLEETNDELKVDVSEDIKALTEGEELTEEFKEKAATIFEAAVVNRVKSELTRINEQYETRLNEEVEQIKEGLVDHIDGYLDYVVEQWIEQNEIALDQGMKSEIVEGFIGGLKNLFQEHYVDIPEEKYDVLGNLQEEIKELHTRLDEQVGININLKQKMTGIQIKNIAEHLAEDLVETDKAKFFNLIEELEVTSVDAFTKKATTIKESYFTKKSPTPASKIGSFVSDNPVTINEEITPQVNPTMNRYVSVLNSIKK